ncbi:putative ribonuclease H superfamily [Helianthus annuus]|nr:putative ribonuclease H superfamily [Helianthus annuus]
MKGRLRRKQKGWLEELPFVLWAYRTTPKDCNGETPFSLTYGTEAIIPTKIGSPTARIKLREAENKQDLRMNLNLLKERREIAAIREAKYKKQLESYYNAKMKKLNLVSGDLVLRANEASLQESTGKLGHNWEGPYRVTWANGKGSCKLETLQGKEVPRTWNLMQLRKYHI